MDIFFSKQKYWSLVKNMEKEDLIEFFWKSYCKDVGVCVKFLRDFVCLVVNFFFFCYKNLAIEVIFLGYPNITKDF